MHSTWDSACQPVPMIPSDWARLGQVARGDALAAPVRR